MHPNTGYGLRKIFQETPMGRYSSSPGAIYPALQNLESHKLITGQTSKGKTGRDVQIFRTTSSGTRALMAWLRQAVTTEQVQRDLDVLLLRFSYLDLVDDLDWSVEFLGQFIDAVGDCRRQVEDTINSMPHSPLHGQLAMANGVVQLDAHAEWARSALTKLKRKRATN